MTTLYGCHNRDKRVFLEVQRGWEIVLVFTSQGYKEVRVPVMEKIQDTLSTLCFWDKKTTDPKCKGCKLILGII